jgi:serine/threonine protein kinase
MGNTSRQYQSRKTFRSRVIYDPKYACRELDNLFSDPDLSLNDPDTEILKDGDTSTVWSTTSGDHKLVVKRYNIKGGWQGLKRMLRCSNAENSWKNAHILKTCGIGTPCPVALVEKRIGPLKRQTYFISEYVEAITCSSFFKEPHQHKIPLFPVAQKIIELFSLLKKYKISHGDMKGTNILISDNKPILTDLDYMQQFRSQSLFKYRHSRDKKRFIRVWQNAPAVAKLFTSLL